MAEDDAEFWLTASEENRAALYESFNRVVKKRGLRWENVLEEALGRAVSSAYRDNFRRDLNKKADYPKLYSFLCRIDPVEARDLDNRTLIPEYWFNFITKYRTYGALDNRPPLERDYRRGLLEGFPSHSDAPYEPFGPLKLYIRGLMVPLYAYALRIFERQFFPVPLHLPGEKPNSRSIARVEPGEQIIETSVFLPLLNEQRTGFNRFICILCDQENAQAIADACDVEGPVPSTTLQAIPGMIIGDGSLRHWAVYELSLEVKEIFFVQWSPRK